MMLDAFGKVRRRRPAPESLFPGAKNTFRAKPSPVPRRADPGRGVAERVLRLWKSTAPVVTERSRAIDVLRAAAVLLVIGCHYVVHPAAAGYAAPIAELWYRMGWAGVDLFFVLSGFLVSGLLFSEFQRNHTVRVARFLTRRALKIWPAYLVYLGFVASWLAILAFRGHSGAPSLWPNFLHVQNYLGTPRLHTWSLAVEEHFYLACAFAAALVVHVGGARVWRRVFPFAVVAALVSVAAWRHLTFAAQGRDALNLFASHLRFDGLLVGVLLAYCSRFEAAAVAWPESHPRTAMLLGGLAALPTMLASPDASPWSAGLGLTIMYLGFGVLVLGLVAYERSRPGRALGSAPAALLARVGVFSYGIYLWHVDFGQTPWKKVAMFLQGIALPPTLVWLVSAVGYVVFAVALGAVMSRLIEMPVLALRDRLLPPAIPVGIPEVVSPAPTLPDGAQASAAPPLPGALPAG